MQVDGVDWIGSKSCRLIDKVIWWGAILQLLVWRPLRPHRPRCEDG